MNEKFEHWIQEIRSEEWPSRPTSPEEKLQPPTPEQAESMDRQLAALGNLMKDFKGWWQLDGAMNVSLVAGHYIRPHADIDISLLRDDIPELENYLRSRGYGFFLLKKEKDDEGKVLRVFKRMGAKNLYRTAEWQYRIAPIDENGKIRTDADLFRVDTAIVERNEYGQLVTWDTVPLPPQWLEGETDFSKGVPIHLSNPSRFIYHKIFFNRGEFDLADLENYVKAGALHSSDLNELEPVLEQSLKKRIEKYAGDLEIAKFVDEVRKRFSLLRGLVVKEEKLKKHG